VRLPPIPIDEFCGLFREHGMEVVGLGIGGEKTLKVEGGRIVRLCPPNECRCGIEQSAGRLE
jgi:hypothetical protein